jgi:hypothetical protein
MEGGEDWQELRQELDPKGVPTGRIVLGQPRPTTPADKVNVSQALFEAQQHLAKAQNYQESLKGYFSSKVNERRDFVSKTSESLFPKYEDAKHPVNKNYQQSLAWIKGFGFNGNPLMDVLARSVALNKHFADKEQASMTAKAKEDKIREDAKRGGPTTASANGSSAAPDPKLATMEKFEKLGLSLHN